MHEDQMIRGFRRAVWKHYRAHGRHDLPWRKTKDPYKILISEVMLQQTQVPRVMEKYKEFLKVFPTVHALASAPLSDVLRIWSGMGYNRRAKYLRAAAIEIVEKYGGRVPKTQVSLRTIPGIGPYTASAILIFAYNIPDTMIETNVRAAYIHHFSNIIQVHKSRNCEDCVPLKKITKAKKDGAIRDTDLLPFIEVAAEGQDPREWHWALMDYGSYLKKIHPNPSRKSAHYAKQSKFEGSLRQVRGAILRELHKGPLYIGRSYVKDLPFEKEKIKSALADLERDGMIRQEKGKWRIA